MYIIITQYCSFYVCFVNQFIESKLIAAMKALEGYDYTGLFLMPEFKVEDFMPDLPLEVITYF